MLHINFIILALFLNSVNNWNVYVGLGSDIQCMHACCHLSLLSTGQYLDTAQETQPSIHTTLQAGRLETHSLGHLSPEDVTQLHLLSYQATQLNH